MKKQHSATNLQEKEVDGMKKIICIGREYGSGGREIGKRLAAILDSAYLDKELLSLAAQKSGISEKAFEKRRGVFGRNTNGTHYGAEILVCDTLQEYEAAAGICLCQHGAKGAIRARVRRA